MPDGRTMLILAAIAGVLYVGDTTVHGIKKLDRKVCHAITLHHKCKPVQPVQAPKDPTTVPTKD